MRTVFLFVLVGAVLLAGCGSKPVKQPPEPREPVPRQEQAQGSLPARPANDWDAAPVQPIPKPPAVEPSLADKKQAQRLALDAAILLDEARRPRRSQAWRALKLDSQTILQTC
jgi:hypothetical protein